MVVTVFVWSICAMRALRIVHNAIQASFTDFSPLQGLFLRVDLTIAGHAPSRSLEEIEDAKRDARWKKDYSDAM